MQPAIQASANHSPPAKRELIDVDDVKAHHPIVEVVARYVPLRRTGRTFVGPCPFHRDTGRPNLVIFPSTESWYCFRCGAGGDAITFVEKRERVGFLDAVAAHRQSFAGAAITVAGSLAFTDCAITPTIGRQPAHRAGCGNGVLCHTTGRP